MNARLRKTSAYPSSTGRTVLRLEVSAGATKAPAVKLRVVAAGLAASLLMLIASVAIAGDAGQVMNLSGILAVKKEDGTSKLLSVKSEVQEGDLLTTEANTYARIKFIDGGEVVLRPGTQLKIVSYRFAEDKPQSDNILLSMLKGGLRAVSGLIGKRNHDAARYNMPTATIGIRGTDWGALYCQNDCGGYQNNEGKTPANGLYVDVASGKIVVSNSQGSQEFSPGQFGFVNLGQPPVIVPPGLGVPISTDKGTNKPPEGVLGNQPNQKDFQCTVDG